MAKWTPIRGEVLPKFTFSTKLTYLVCTSEIEDCDDLSHWRWMPRYSLIPSPDEILLALPLVWGTSDKKLWSRESGLESLGLLNRHLLVIKDIASSL